jgi:hypothetical protein
VYDKLGVSDRLELALYCLHHQLLKTYMPDQPEGLPATSVTNTPPLRSRM